MTARPLTLTLTLAATVVLAQPRGAQFLTLEQAQPVLTHYRNELPAELKASPEELKVRWPAWVARRDQEVRARLDQGEEDTITNLLRFGVTYTRQPRIDWPSLFKYGQSVGVDFWAQTRAEELIRALSAPGKNEHLLATRSFLEKKGHSLKTPAERARVKQYLLANLARMQKEFVAYQEELRSLREAGKLDEARLMELDSHLFANRGISLDTNIRPNFAIEQGLKDLIAKSLLKPGSIRRVAIIGPGLDFVNKEEGVDFYPIQTIQPLAVIDSLYKLKLAHPTSFQVVTYDISARVNQHIRLAKQRAVRGLPYQLQIPWDATRLRSKEFTSYWQEFGLSIGRNTKPFPVPESTPELTMRALQVRPSFVRMIEPIDMNVVFQHEELPAEARFDLVIGTNIFVYYGAFEQALAVANLSQMMRPGGVLLSNNLLASYAGSSLKETGRVSAALSKTEAETIFCYQRVP